MSGPLAAALTAWRVLRAEGIAAALDRARDRAAERREDGRARRVGPGGMGRAPVLNVLGFPAVARLGGVPLQLRHRLAHERHHRPTALLARIAGGWRLDWCEGNERRTMTWGAREPGAGVLEDTALEEGIGRALTETGAHVIHLEGVAGLAPRSATRASDRCEVLVTIHDFSPFCPRPHLWEATAGRFCGWSRDESRCHACLATDFDVARGFEREWRGAMADLLGAARALVLPSAYMQSAWRALLPGLAADRQHVIEPGAPGADRGEPRRPGPVRRVALVGSVKPAKGAGLLGDIVRDAPGLDVLVLGGGDAPLLHALRRLPRTRVRGYYRAGSLAHHLRARRIDVALLLSLVPESYGLTLDECWQAGVPVVAFDHGAVAERIRRSGGGVLVPVDRGAAGVADVLRGLRAGTRPLPATPDPAALPTPGQAALAHLSLYRRLGVLE